jgi:MFS family permease
MAPPPRHTLRPPQFRLRTLLLFVTACGILLSLRQWVDPIIIAAILFLFLSIVCHVAGNAIGTRLRAIGDRPERDSSDQSSPIRRVPRPHEFAPPTHLSHRQGLGLLILVATSIGIAGGAVGGGLFTFASRRGPPDPFNIAVGVIAFAVLGGLAAFAIASFAQVLTTTISQALNPTTTSAPSDAAPPMTNDQ